MKDQPTIDALLPKIVTDYIAKLEKLGTVPPVEVSVPMSQGLSLGVEKF